MKNNYKQLTKSPSEPAILKRSASHALRSSFRLPKKRTNSQFHALNLEQLPTYIPPKAAALLQINVANHSKNNNNHHHINPLKMSKINAEQPIKIATIRKRSVWANASLSKRAKDNVNELKDEFVYYFVSFFLFT